MSAAARAPGPAWTPPLVSGAGPPLCAGSRHPPHSSVRASITPFRVVYTRGSLQGLVQRKIMFPLTLCDVDLPNDHEPLSAT